MRSYMVCTTPRTGSQWLCQRLTAMGYGKPDEHLKAVLFGGKAPHEMWTLHALHGIYAVKVFIEPIEPILPLEDLLPEGPRGYVYLTRDDLEEQAWSMALAARYGNWALPSDRSLPINAEETAAARQDICASMQAWERWFEDHHVDPLRVTFEASLEDANRVDLLIGSYLDHTLGLTLEPHDQPATGERAMIMDATDG